MTPKLPARASRLAPAPLAVCIAMLLAAPAAVASKGAAHSMPHFTATPAGLRHLADARRPDAERRAVAQVRRAGRPAPDPGHVAATLPVTSCGDDGDPGTLRNVVAIAASGDTVDASALTCGTITLTSGAIVTLLDDLTIVGPGEDALTVDGAGADSVLVHAGYGTLTLSDLTIADGNYQGYPFGLGGCAYSISSMALTRVTVTGCTTGSPFNSYGGGVMARGDLTLDATTLSNNTVVGGEPWGGGAYAGGNLVATNSTISGNTVTGTGGNAFAYGGGLLSVHDMALTGSTVSGNTVNIDDGDYVFGGGIALAGNLTLTGSTVTGNVASASGAHAYGGGLLAFYDATIYGSAFDNNRADRGGGIMMMNPANTLNVSDSTLSGNIAEGVADGGGGGIATLAALHIGNATVAFNSATAGGGGILFLGADGGLESQSTIVADNQAGAKAAYAADLGSYATLVAAGANNLIVTSDGTLPPDTLHDDPQLLPLADNGGATRTHALAAGSPAIDTGNNAANLASDQRGDGFARVVGNAADIGAFEMQKGGTATAPTVGKSFSPASIAPGSTTTLTITLGNANATLATLEAPLVDALPSGVVVADTPNAATTCPGGTVTADAGGASVSLGAGAGIPASGLCTVTVDATAASDGSYTNVIPAGALHTDLGDSATDATAQLTVAFLGQPPTVAMTFEPDDVPVNGISVWTITLANSNDQDATLTADFLVGPFNTHFSVADPAGATTTCPGGTVTVADDRRSFSLNTGAAIPADGSCDLSVPISIDIVSQNTFFIPAGAVETDLGANVDGVQATLLVDPTVTPSAGPGGTIAPSVPELVHVGDSTDFTVTPNPGFHIDAVGGTCGGSLNVDVFTTFPVFGDCTVEATFASDVVDRIFANGFD